MDYSLGSLIGGGCYLLRRGWRLISPAHPQGYLKTQFLTRYSKVTSTDAEGGFCLNSDGLNFKATEDEMVGSHHCLNEHEQTPGDSEGQENLNCCSPWGSQIDMTS